MKGQNKKMQKSITILALGVIFLELCAILGLIYFERGKVFFLVMAEVIVFLGIIWLSFIISDAKKEEKKQEQLAEQRQREKASQENGRLCRTQEKRKRLCRIFHESHALARCSKWAHLHFSSACANAKYVKHCMWGGAQG